MDNDTLINQARNLYAALYVEQQVLMGANKPRFERLGRAVVCAYCRYQRRLNRCVVCYQTRKNDCTREFLETGPRFCPAPQKSTIDHP
ncbi:MAG: hypothetical protein NTV43_14575 [Methylococcales bacterium]|nr:hypothetical protein [Methylococcales bacterium]